MTINDKQRNPFRLMAIEIRSSVDEVQEDLSEAKTAAVWDDRNRRAHHRLSELQEPSLNDIVRLEDASATSHVVSRSEQALLQGGVGGIEGQLVEARGIDDIATADGGDLELVVRHGTASSRIVHAESPDISRERVALETSFSDLAVVVRSNLPVDVVIDFHSGGR